MLDLSQETMSTVPQNICGGGCDWRCNKSKPEGLSYIRPRGSNLITYPLDKRSQIRRYIRGAKEKRKDDDNCPLRNNKRENKNEERRRKVRKPNEIIRQLASVLYIVV